VRQMPGSAKGVMFITLKDESANANLIIWANVFERNRRNIIGSSMLGCVGKVRHAGGVSHLIVEQTRDMSADLGRVSRIEDVLPFGAGRGDDAKQGG
jgi:DNA polymerase III alpha subunit